MDEHGNRIFDRELTAEEIQRLILKNNEDRKNDEAYEDWLRRTGRVR